MPATLSVRSQMAAASKRIGRLRRIDRAAVFLITLGGIAVVVAVLGILVFVAGEAMPLFTARQARHRVASSGSRPRCGRGQRRTLRAVGVDEYRKYLYTVEPAGVVAFYRLDIGQRVRSAVPVPGLRRRDGHLLIAQRARPLCRRGAERRARVVDAGALPAAVRRGGAQGYLDRGSPSAASSTLDPQARPVTPGVLHRAGRPEVRRRPVGDNEIAYWWTDTEGAEHLTHAAVRSRHIASPRCGSAATAPCSQAPTADSSTTGSSTPSPSSPTCRR